MQPSTIRLFTATAMLSQFGAAAMAQCGFLERSPAFLPPVGGSALATADFNGDGKLDLAIANPWSGLASVSIGNGDGTFQSPQSFNAWAGHGIACGDFNEDGLIDLAVSNESNNLVSLLIATSQSAMRATATCLCCWPRRKPPSRRLAHFRRVEGAASSHAISMETDTST